MILTQDQQEQIDAHHRRWADYRAAKIEERNEIWMLYLHDPVFRELCNSRLREETAEADLFFINTFCTTFDPRRQDHGESAEVEFILDEEQEQFIYWHWHLENLVREGRGLIKITAHELKSRDRGGSWMTIALKVKRFLFRQNYISLVGHETEDDIDKPEAPKSIFWRVDFLIRMLPKEMIPDGYFRKDKPQEVSQKYHRHLGRNNPITGSVLTGDPVTDTWGGGDRTSDAWMDEAPECLSEDTEILTPFGWKSRHEIEEGDIVVAFDMKKETYQYEEVSRVVRRHYAGKMIHLHTKAMDCLVTPGHSVVLSRMQRSRRHKNYGEWYPYTTTEARDVPTCIRVPSGGAPCGEGVPLSDDLLRILGWIITDGTCSKVGMVSITQAANTYKFGKNLSEEMKTVISREFPIHGFYRYEASGNRSAGYNLHLLKKNSDRVMEILEGECHRIPRWVLLNASLRQLQCLYRGLVEGDGTAKTKQQGAMPCNFYVGYNTGLADDFQELCLKIGISSCRTLSKNGQWNITMSERRQQHVPQYKEDVDYDGEVWCVTVPSHAIVVKRNGKVFVTGNCGGNNKDNARAGFAKVGFTTNFRLTTGTPPTEGMANWWSKLVNDPDPTKRQVPDPSVDMTKWWEKPEWQWKEGMARVFYLCWENDPRYNAHYLDDRGRKVYPWKESLPEHFSDQEIASEVQRDFKGSVTGIVYPQASRVRRMQFGYDPRLPLYLNMDPGLGDKFALLWRQYDFHSGRHRILQTYRNNNKKTKFYIPLILGEEFLSLADDEKLTDEDLEIIARVTGWRYAGFYGDSAGRNRQNNDGRSVYDELRIESTAIDPYRNINVRYTVFGNNEHYQRVDSVRKTLPLCDVNERWAPHFLPAIESCRWPNEGTNTTNAPRMPRHNTLDRDLVTAFEFGCVADIARLHSGDEKVFQPQTRSFTWGSRMAGAEEEEEQEQAGGIWVPRKVIEQERRQPSRIHRCRR